MKIVAPILAILGGFTGFGLWALYLMMCSCAMPPQYAKATPVIATTPPLSKAIIEVAAVSVPVVALLATVVAVLLIIPRFRRPALTKAEMVCGVVLVASLGVIAAYKGSALLGIIPGILVVVGGFLAYRATQVRIVPQPSITAARATVE
jgi:hypothetical protein